jgi:hypothetical protein
MNMPINVVVALGCVQACTLIVVNLIINTYMPMFMFEGPFTNLNIYQLNSNDDVSIEVGIEYTCLSWFNTCLILPKSIITYNLLNLPHNGMNSFHNNKNRNL